MSETRADEKRYTLNLTSDELASVLMALDNRVDLCRGHARECRELAAPEGDARMLALAADWDVRAEHAAALHSRLLDARAA